MPRLAGYRASLLDSDPEAPRRLARLWQSWQEHNVSTAEALELTTLGSINGRVFGADHLTVRRQVERTVAEPSVTARYGAEAHRTLMENAELIGLVELGLLAPEYPHVMQAEAPVLTELAYYAIEPGDRVAEIAAGTGTFARVLHVLYPDITVYANEVDTNFVAYYGALLNQYPETLREGTLIPVQGSKRSLGLPEPVDHVIIRNSFHHFTRPRAMLRSIREALRPGGRLYLLEPEDPAASSCPQVVSPAKTRMRLRAAGYRLLAEHHLSPWRLYVFTAE